MIKINLLNSVTERQSGAAVAVEKKVSSPVSRLLLMTIAVFTLTAGLIGWDLISSTRAKAEAQRQLDEQKKKAADLEKVMAEQKELEDKIKNVDLRIDAIKKLRNTQAGPSAVLSSIAERIASEPNIYLESIEQTADQLTIKGSSPSEQSVTQFGRSLEFSSGLFSNLSIETQRKELNPTNASMGDVDTPRDEVIEFTIRCSYTPENGNSSTKTTTAENKGAPQNAAQPAAPNAAKPPAAGN
ncbi:MAG: PilN domain-containing protein [Pyrinomonadaceae bacterium]